MRKFFGTLIILLAIVLCTSCSSEKVVGNWEVVPLPQSVKLNGDKPFVLDKSTIIVVESEEPEVDQVARMLNSYIFDIIGDSLNISNEKKLNSITLRLSDNGNDEGYTLVSDKNGVVINGTTPRALFYGVQTLRKAIPAKAENIDIELPAVTIKDFPRFKYRGIHLDVARHFVPADSIKRFIDILALHNINNFHWHLTEDQGWRVEIKKYPELTKVGSKRKETVIGRNSGEYDNKEYGGYYTQDEIKEIVKYASDRFINIVPEIDLPGHMLAALTSYPELGCTGGPYEVATSWGVFDDVLCAGNEKTMIFVEDVLAEIIELFPSEYIHIGGDECPKVRWKECPKCQARIKAEGLKADDTHTAEDRLQSYVINRMEKFVNSKGRKIIGWDEILEGGLAPGATVMSWRGMAGGIEAANQSHDVIMTPDEYMYFNYYQSLDPSEPLAIGGFVSIEKVYGFDPVPASLASDKQQYILGAQANLWSEYLINYSQVEYMLLPRIAALSEVLWSDASRRDYITFLPRLSRLTEIYDKYGYNYAKHIFDVAVQLKPNTESGKLEVTLSAIGDDAKIYYTLDGSQPDTKSILYTGKFDIDKDADIKAIVVRSSGNSRVVSESVKFNKATLRPISFNQQPSETYTYEGASVLNNSLKGDNIFKSGKWIGFNKNDMDVTITLADNEQVSEVSFNALIEKGSWILGTEKIIVSASDDGKNFKRVGEQTYPALKADDKDGIYNYKVTFNSLNTKYLRVEALVSLLPEWHAGAGIRSYLFVDEIEVR